MRDQLEVTIKFRIHGVPSRRDIRDAGLVSLIEYVERLIESSESMYDVADGDIIVTRVRRVDREAP